MKALTKISDIFLTSKSALAIHVEDVSCGCVKVYCKGSRTVFAGVTGSDFRHRYHQNKEGSAS